MNKRIQDNPFAILLPAFASGELILASDLNAADRALVYLETYFGLPEESHQFDDGQILTANDFNALYRRTRRMIDKADSASSLHMISSNWSYFPVNHGEIISADILNELFGRINSVLRWVVRIEGQKAD